MKRRLRRLRRESGQATVEYILVLAIAISIILGLLYQFHQGFRTYAEAFFDTYVACLLEMGELPGTPNTTCEMPDFQVTFRETQGPASVPSAGVSGSGSGNSSSASAAANNNRDGNGEVLGRRGTGGASGRVSNTGSFGQRRQASTPVGDAKDVANQGAFANDALLGSGRSSSVGNVSADSKSERTRLDFAVSGDEDSARKGRPRSSVSGQAFDANALKPRKVVVDMNRKPAVAPELDGSGFSFGQLVRWLIILGIIIAIVIFFGGQIMQISRSREKGGGD